VQVNGAGWFWLFRRVSGPHRPYATIVLTQYKCLIYCRLFMLSVLLSYAMLSKGLSHRPPLLLTIDFLAICILVSAKPQLNL
jgi:hypothetical protein